MKRGSDLLASSNRPPQEKKKWVEPVAALLMALTTLSTATGPRKSFNFQRPMPESSFERSSKRVLDPIDRVSEVLFGLIMVLTFTGSLSVAEAGRESIRTMLIGALGCNLAWGIIDGVFYLMGCLAEKGRGLLALHAVRKTIDPQQARRLIAGTLPPVIASILQPAELETMHERLKQLPEPPERARLHMDDWLAPGQLCASPTSSPS